MFHDYREQAHQQLVKEFPGIAAEITSQRLEILPVRGNQHYSAPPADPYPVRRCGRIHCRSPGGDCGW